MFTKTCLKPDKTYTERALLQANNIILNMLGRSLQSTDTFYFIFEMDKKNKSPKNVSSEEN